MNNIVQGKHACWVCGHSFLWNASLMPGRGAPVFDATAEVAAVNSGMTNGKMDHVVLEVVATCSQCTCKNKFQHIHKLDV